MSAYRCWHAYVPRWRRICLWGVPCIVGLVELLLARMLLAEAAGAVSYERMIVLVNHIVLLYLGLVDMNVYYGAYRADEAGVELLKTSVRGKRVFQHTIQIELLMQLLHAYALSALSPLPGRLLIAARQGAELTGAVLRQLGGAVTLGNALGMAAAAMGMTLCLRHITSQRLYVIVMYAAAVLLLPADLIGARAEELPRLHTAMLFAYLAAGYVFTLLHLRRAGLVVDRQWWSRG